MRLASVVRNDVFFKLGGEVISRLVFLFFFFYVGRKLAAPDFGTLSLCISLTYIIGVALLDPGLNVSTIQLLITDKASAARTAGAVFTLKVLLFVPVLVLLAILHAVFGGRLPGFPLLSLAALFTFFTALLEYFSCLTNSCHRMDLEAGFKLANRALIVMLGAIAVRSHTASAVLWAMMIATGLCCGVACILTGKTCIPIRPCWDSDTAKRTLRLGLPVAGTMVVGAIYLKWDLVVLSAWRVGAQEVGWYAAAFKITEAFSAVPGILGAALFPTLVQLRSSNSLQLDRLLRLSTKALLVVSFPVAALTSVFAQQIIAAVYGARYMPGAAVLAVLIWCIVPMFLYFYLMFVNIAAGEARHNFLAGCAALAGGLLTNMILIPRIGYLGAAWAALAANLSFAVLATSKVCRIFPRARILQAVLRAAAAAGVMAAVFWGAPGPVLLRTLLGLLSYAAALVLGGSITGEDLRIALQLVRIRPAAVGNAQP